MKQQHMTVTVDEIRRLTYRLGSRRKVAKHLNVPESTLRCFMKRVQAQIDAERRIEKLLREAYLALLVVKAGIWRNEELNACGLVGAGVAVHSVEASVGEIEAWMDETK